MPWQPRGAHRQLAHDPNATKTTDAILHPSQSVNYQIWFCDRIKQNQSIKQMTKTTKLKSEVCTQTWVYGANQAANLASANQDNRK